MKIEQGLKGLAGIYIIINKITHKSYVGSSINMYNRAYTYRCLAKQNKIHNIYLQNSINKYGLDNFEFKRLEIINSSNRDKVEVNILLLKKEQFYINLLRPEYNLRTIVDRNLGVNHSSITKEKISESLKMAFKTGKKRVNRIYSHNVPTTLFTTKGEIVKKFDGLAQCAEHLGVTYQTLSYTISSKKRICKSHIVLKSNEEHLILNYIK